MSLKVKVLEQLAVSPSGTKTSGSYFALQAGGPGVLCALQVKVLEQLAVSPSGTKTSGSCVLRRRASLEAREACAVRRLGRLS